MKLPNAENAVIAPEKLRDYLLSPTHPVGKFKAVFFRSLGYTNDNWQELEAGIRSLLEQEASVEEQTEYGQKYEVRGTIAGPSNRTANLVTAWIILNGETIPRFVTAHPGD